MAATDPDQVISLFVKYFNVQDLDGLLGLYEPDAVMPQPGGEPLVGVDAIRGALQSFLSAGGTMSIDSSAVLETGDLALTHNKWRLVSGGSTLMEGVTAEVVRRGADGTWRYILDNPMGGAILDTAG